MVYIAYIICLCVRGEGGGGVMVYIAYIIGFFFKSGALTPRSCGLSLGGTGFELLRRKRDALTRSCVYRMRGVSTDG